MMAAGNRENHTSRIVASVTMKGKGALCHFSSLQEIPANVGCNYMLMSIIG